jgi:hypothetical protein
MSELRREVPPNLPTGVMPRVSASSTYPTRLFTRAMKQPRVLPFRWRDVRKRLGSGDLGRFVLSHIGSSLLASQVIRIVNVLRSARACGPKTGLSEDCTSKSTTKESVAQGVAQPHLVAEYEA